MHLFSFWPGRVQAVGILSWALLTLPHLAQAQAPVIIAVVPMANVRNVPRSSAVQVTFDRALTAGSGAALKVFSAQRGGLRSAGSGTTTASGPTVGFAPSYPFMPGETVQATVTTAATAAAGGSLARAQVVQFTAAAGAGPGTFGGSSDVAVGNSPSNVAVGDVDGDGDLDMLVTNAISGTVSVRLNDGRGVFTTMSTNPNAVVGVIAASMVMGDVDGDGDLDLLTADYYAHAVNVRLNNGNGVFSGGSDPAVGSLLQGVTVGDVDGDGDLDILTANSGDNTVSVRLNNGRGAFGGGSDIAVGSHPGSVTVGDVDGDGDLDLLVSNFFDNTVSVRLNNGNGSFGGGSDIAVANRPRCVVAADVDGDGDLDLLTANYSASTVSVRLNNGNGGFGSGSDPAVGSAPANVAVGDVDGDGDLDLLTASVGSNTVSVRLNDGSGGFSGGSDPAVGRRPEGVAVGDVDGDGDLDLLAANFNDNTVSVLLNQTQPLPRMTGLSLTSGPVGLRATITGTEFTGVTGVRFNGTNAPGFVVNSPTSITVAVPAGAATGLVTVTTPGGTSNGLVFTVTGNLAVGDASLRAGGGLFPNPTQGRVTVRVPAVAGATQVAAVLLNALGQAVQARTAALPADGAVLVLDVTALSPGVYALRLTVGASTLVKRLVVE